MTEIAGIDTITGLAGEPPTGIPLPYNLVYKEQLQTQVWNGKYIAIILYCFKCKEPLVWHSPPDGDNILFHCPKCKRIWFRDDAWIEKGRMRAASKEQGG